MSRINRSFWQDKAGQPAVIREGPVPTEVGDDEILVRVEAWGMNPYEAFVQKVDVPVFSYPGIPGTDVAGTVELVGGGSAAASRFRAGDRVCGKAVPGAPGRPATGGFQDYVVLEAVMTAKVPDALTAADAATFPLCIATAAYALFSQHFLALALPRADGGAAAPAGKTVLVWGGASAVGSNAIQMLRMAGVDVVTTCSPRNFAAVRALGAAAVFDYAAPGVVDDVAAELDRRGAVCAGILQAAGPFDAVAPCCRVARKCCQNGIFVACANVVPEDAVPEGVRAEFVLTKGASKPVFYETSSFIFEHFLEKVLANGSYKVVPKPEIVNDRGLDGIQEALDAMAKDVSAKKLIVVAK
ncbi:GroES-like protein [Hypoxylon sp. FL1284]|nr:GroES-like protein [Hypoxylon sp. FL1284]